MDKKTTQYIHIDNGRVEYQFFVFSTQVSENQWSIRIPAYKIGFSAPSKEEGIKRAKAMVQSFYQMWLLKEGWSKFVLQLHHLGFRAANHDFVMSKLLKRQPIVIDLKTKAEGGDIVIDSIAA